MIVSDDPDLILDVSELEKNYDRSWMFRDRSGSCMNFEGKEARRGARCGAQGLPLHRDAVRSMTIHVRFANRLLNQVDLVN